MRELTLSVRALRRLLRLGGVVRRVEVHSPSWGLVRVSKRAALRRLSREGPWKRVEVSCGFLPGELCLTLCPR